MSLPNWIAPPLSSSFTVRVAAAGNAIPGPPGVPVFVASLMQITIVLGPSTTVSSRNGTRKVWVVSFAAKTTFCRATTSRPDRPEQRPADAGARLLMPSNAPRLT